MASRKGLLPCLKACMFREDRKAHGRLEKTAAGRAYLETHKHTDELLERCVPLCIRKKRKRRGKR